MNYTTATDFEINKRLRELVLMTGYPSARSVEYDDRQKCFWVENIGFSSFAIPDYCNDWAAIGPLFEEHQSALLETYCYDWPDDSDYSTRLDNAMDVYQTNNIKRAAAICIIKILERE